MTNLPAQEKNALVNVPAKDVVLDDVHAVDVDLGVVECHSDQLRAVAEVEDDYLRVRAFTVRANLWANRNQEVPTDARCNRDRSLLFFCLDQLQFRFRFLCGVGVSVLILDRDDLEDDDSALAGRIFTVVVASSHNDVGLERVSLILVALEVASPHDQSVLVVIKLVPGDCYSEARLTCPRPPSY